MALLLSACTPLPSGAGVPSADANTAAASLTPVRLGVGFIPNVQFAPFYVGIEKGFFSAEGLDVSLDYGFENDYLALVGTDELQFMVGSGDQIILGRAQGLPVQYILNWYAKYPVVIFAKSSMGITAPTDLAGKTIGIPGPFGASYVALRGILEAGGLTEADITLESIGFTQAAAVSEDQVEAAVDYGVNGPVVLAQAGIETTQIGLDNHIRIPANGLVTNEKTIGDNPQLVAKMVHATAKAIQYTLDHPDEAFEIALHFVPEAAGDNLDANRAVFEASLTYWTPPTDQPLGVSQLADWQEAAAFMQRIGLVEAVLDAESLFTNQFIQSGQ
ncbi:MAG: ABC transporter substrate-binding protein [Caldilineaceae bacterium]